MTFQPGQSGNPGGRSKERPFRDALRMECIAAENGDEAKVPKRSLRAIARALLDRAGEGDATACREIADRLDGKVPQAVVGDSEHDPVQFIVTGVKREGDSENGS